jgi:hypothetical protein
MPVTPRLLPSSDTTPRCTHRPARALAGLILVIRSERESGPGRCQAG